MKILLLYPEFPDTFWSFKYALRFIRKRASLPPLGLITVAAMLPKHWETKLIDLNVCQLTEATLAWADLVFISAMAAQKSSAKKLIGRCCLARKEIVAGGPLFTSDYESFPEVNYFVLNEAEITLPLFLADRKQGVLQRVYSSSEFSDMEKTPIPRWDLLDINAYATMAVQYSRGCPFGCDFCDVTMLFGHKPRIKTARQMIAELDSLLAAGWRGSVFFVDDNFIGNRHRLKKELLPALIAWQERTNRLAFFTEASINLADDEELIKMMVEAGFDAVFVGIETPNQEALEECGKAQNQKRDMLADVKKLQRAGLQVQAGFIVGFDSDDATIFQCLADFIMKSGITTAMVGMLNAPYGTRLWQRLNRANRLTGEISGDNTDGTTNIIPLMGIDKLRDGYRRLMKYLYSPSNYYRRVRVFLSDYKITKNHQPVNFQRVLAVFRACWHLGFRRSGRWHFWALLSWAFLRRPRLFPMAVEMAIKGDHFRRVTELHIQ
ncbi:MAG: DUF4070 domain-containing protein [bacterium]|nr:DUF4070 domain-containing protein [bacterium]